MSSYSPFVQPMVVEARRRGIRVQPLPEMSDSYAILTYRGQRRVICQSIADHLDTITFRLLTSRAAGLRLLQEQGYPVVPGQVVGSLEEAQAFRAQRLAVTLRPLAHTGGVGASAGLRSREALEAAWQDAADHSGQALIQEHLEGEAVRVLVVGERTFALQRLPAQLEGDGMATIRGLVQAWNESLRWSHHAIRMDGLLEAWLATKGYTLDTVLPQGAVVALSALAHTRRGGFCHDCSDLLAPEAVELTRRVAQDLGTPLLALELQTPDLVHHAGRIIGVSPFTDLTRFEAPTSGKPRMAAAAWLDVLFPGS